MEVRGERRGFMETMRAFFSTIRKRIGRQRTRQRTTNYRVCSNLAIAKMESKKEGKAKKAKVTKGKADENGTNRKENGTPRGLRERMTSALRAFREGRKPRWVRQRGWRRNMDGLNMQDTQADSRLTQARENLHEIQATPKTQARVDIHTQAGQDILSQAIDSMDGLNMDLHEPQASPDAHTGEDILAQTEEHIQSLTREKIPNQVGEDFQTPTGDDIQTGAGQDDQTQPRMNFHETGEDIQKAGDLQTQVDKDIQTEEGEDQPDAQDGEDMKTEARESLQTQTSSAIQAREDIQNQAQEDLLPAEPASWVVTHGQMWEKMAQHDGYDLYREDLHATQDTEEPASWVVANSQMWQRMAQRHDEDLYVEGAYDSQPRESLDDILAREGLEAVEPASWFAASGKIWGNSNNDNNSVTSSMPFGNSWLSSMVMESWADRGVQVTSPYMHMAMF